jgi:hypothetical protein
MRRGEAATAGNQELLEPANVVQCLGCSSSGSPTSRGWHAARVDDPKTDNAPLAYYCPTCAGEELGFSRRV